MTPAIGVIGARSIGVSWSIVMARAGHRVHLHDSDVARQAAGMRELQVKLKALERQGLHNEAPPLIAGRVNAARCIDEAVRDAVHVQECVPEDRGDKRGP